MEVSKEEEGALDEFRKRLSDLHPKENVLLADMHLIRWLRARDLNLDKAEDMLRNHLGWRREHEIDSILSKEVPEAWRAEFPCEIVGHDKNSNPLVVIPYGKMDIKKGLREKGKEESKIMANYYLESVFQAAVAKSNGKEMKRFSMILDVGGLTYSQFASVEVVDYLFGCLQLFEKNYPEMLATGFVVNAPRVWSLLWSMGKVFVHQRTQEKVLFLPHDKEAARQILFQHIDESQFPLHYGGTAYMKYPEPVRIVDVNENKPSSSGFLGFFRK